MPVMQTPSETFPVKPGEKVRVTQVLRGRQEVWETTVEGVVEAVRKEPTGSWYAQGKDDRLWLLRVRLRKADGEITNLVVGPSTRIEKR
jgi:hypothetical protein